MIGVSAEANHPITPAVPRVLLVDDHEANLIILAKGLKALEVECVVAHNGEDAIALAREQEFAAILLDVQMPGLDGFETALQIRAESQGTPAPIIFITAGERLPETAYAGYASGAIDFLYKPIDRFLLSCKLKVLLDLYRQRQQLHDATRALLRVNQQMKQLLLSVGDAIVGIAGDGRIDFVNPAAAALLNLPADVLTGMPLAEATGCPGFNVQAADSVFINIYDEPATRGEMRFVTQTGRAFDAEYVLSGLPAANGQARSWVLVFRDVSERQRTIARLRQLAEHDTLTGLANRATFDRALAQLLTEVKGRAGRCGVMFIDLNGFKKINDRLGHAAGDELLIEFGRRLRKLLPPPYLCARLGGDEFGILLPAGVTAAGAHAVSSEVAAATGAPYWHGGEALEVGASIGIALYPDHAASQSGLLRAADLAMYRAKADRQLRVVFAEAESSAI